MIAEHLFREGRFEVGEIFAREAGLAGVEAIRQPDVSLHAILRQIREKNPLPALLWASEHKEQLAPDGRPTAFEFKLHTLSFVSILKGTGECALAGRPSFLKPQHWAIIVVAAGPSNARCEVPPFRCLPCLLGPQVHWQRLPMQNSTSSVTSSASCLRSSG